jgi:hypothetical protein
VFFPNYVQPFIENVSPDPDWQDGKDMMSKIRIATHSGKTGKSAASVILRRAMEYSLLLGGVNLVLVNNPTTGKW